MGEFKDSTKTQYSKGGPVGPKGAAKVAKVMGEFKRGSLHSGADGPKVKSRKQAVAIALSEARRNPMKKAEGGRVENISSRPLKVGKTDEEHTAERMMRSAALEAREEQALMRQPAPRPAPQRNLPPARDPREPLVRKTPLMQRLTTLPSERGEFRVKR